MLLSVPYTCQVTKQDMRLEQQERRCLSFPPFVLQVSLHREYTAYDKYFGTNFEVTIKVNSTLTYVTSMNGQCYHFMNGHCQYGSACRFSHNVHHSDRQSSQRRHSDRSHVPPRRPAADNEVASTDGREWSRSEVSSHKCLFVLAPCTAAAALIFAKLLPQACYNQVSESIWSLRVMSYNLLADALVEVATLGLLSDLYQTTS